MSYELVDEQGDGGDFATSAGLQELRDADIPQGLAEFLDRGTLTPEECSRLIVELSGGPWDWIADILDSLKGNVFISNGIVEDDEPEAEPAEPETETQLHSREYQEWRDKQALQNHLINTDRNRDLNGLEARHVGTYMPGTATMQYLDVPGVDQMHVEMGLTPDLDTDPKRYAERRAQFFRKQPSRRVLLRDIVFTQTHVHQGRVEDMSHDPESLNKPVQMLGQYLMDGHHRVVARHVAGKQYAQAQVFEHAKQFDLSGAAYEAADEGLRAGVDRRLEELLAKAFHGDHDQEDHGNWADDKETPGEDFLKAAERLARPSEPPDDWKKPSSSGLHRGRTNEQVALDWLERHEVEKDGDQFVFYHATPKRSVSTIEEAGVRKGSYIATNEKDALFYALHGPMTPAGRGKKAKVAKLLLHPWEFNPGVTPTLAIDYRSPHFYAEWDESKHPRQPKGDPTGGQFAGGETPAEVKRWFGKSKITDDKGEPLLVHHGTQSEGFKEFDPKRIGSTMGRKQKDEGFWFADQQSVAEQFAMLNRDKPIGQVKSGYLKMEKPYVWDRTKELQGQAVRNAIKGGYDGVIFPDIWDGMIEQHTQYLVFKPDQVKITRTRKLPQRGYAEWDESKVKRQPKGSEAGGEFAPEGGASSFPKATQEQIDKAFGSWGANLKKDGWLYGWRTSGKGGASNVGEMAATEGVGLYIAKNRETAEFFGKPTQLTFPTPTNPMIVDEEPLHILHETDEIMQPPAASDSPWLAANKEAIRRSGVTDENWGEKSKTGDLTNALTDVMRENGYDAVYVKSGGEEWVVLIPPKKGARIKFSFIEEFAEWQEEDHPRHPKGDPRGGKFAPKGTDPNAIDPDERAQTLPPEKEGTHEHPLRVKTVEEAVAAILGGQVVEVQDHRTVYIALDRLQAMAKEIKKLGKKAPVYDLCNVMVAGLNVFCVQQMKTKRFPQGIPRIEMPQIGGKPIPGSRAESFPRNPWDPTEVDGSQDFIRFAEQHGLKVTPGMVSALSLRPSQRELVGPKVAAMVVDKNFDAVKNPLFISKDNYVIDGHHRWAAVVARDMEDKTLGDIQMKTLRVDAPISEVYFMAMRWGRLVGIRTVKGVAASEERLAREYRFHEEYAWDEEKHPRHPGGSAQGGEFAPAGGGSGEPQGQAALVEAFRGVKRSDEAGTLPEGKTWSEKYAASLRSQGVALPGHLGGDALPRFLEDAEFAHNADWPEYFAMVVQDELRGVDHGAPVSVLKESPELHEMRARMESYFRDYDAGHPDAELTRLSTMLKDAKREHTAWQAEHGKAPWGMWYAQYVAQRLSGASTKVVHDALEHAEEMHTAEWPMTYSRELLREQSGQSGLSAGEQAEYDRIVALTGAERRPEKLASQDDRRRYLSLRLKRPLAASFSFPGHKERPGQARLPRGESDRREQAFEAQAGWDESKHPRHPPGSAIGGEFAPAGGAAEEVGAAEFIAARNKTTRAGFLSPLEPENLVGYKLIVNSDKTIGAAVSPDGDIQNVFNNGGPKGGAAEIILDAIESGGRTLDAFDNFLPDYYAQFGFEETGRVRFNREYAPAGWDYDRYGEPDVVFMRLGRYAAEDREKIAARAHNRKEWKSHERTTRYFDDWDAAKEDSRRTRTPRQPIKTPGKRIEPPGIQPSYRASQDSRRDRVGYAEWDEEKHPRHEAGSPQGGEFAPKSGGGRDDAPSDAAIKSWLDEMDKIEKGGGGLKRGGRGGISPRSGFNEPDLIDKVGKRVPLAEAENVLRSRKHTEAVAIFDRDGKLVDFIEGEGDAVRVPDYMMEDGKHESWTITHNHPNSGGEYPNGASLSSQDVGMAMQLDAAEIRAVARGPLGDFDFSLKRPPGGWPNRRNFGAAYANAEAALGRAFDRKYRSKKMTLGQFNLAFSHAIMTRVSKLMNLPYKMTRRRRKRAA